MSSFPRRLNVFFLAVSFFLLSCVNDNPETSLVNSKLIYDFKSEESSPDVRLSVFVAVDSNVQMGTAMKLFHDESGLEWKCSGDGLNKIDMNGMKWVGSTNFVPVAKDLLPEGDYTVVYEDLAERESSVSFSLAYPRDIASCRSKDLPEAFNSPSSMKIAVYSNEDVLLYFGEKPSSWNSSEDIIMEYKNAWCTRVCYTLNRDSVYCLMPPVLLGNKDFIKAHSETIGAECN